MAMARMFLAGCLWHAICLTFAFADSQCVDGQDSQREAAGLKSPSLVQLNAGRKTTLEMDTSSESLVGFSQMVQDLAEKVAGHNYTLKKAESDAIKLIRKWIENMNKTLNLQHKEDQAEVDRVRDLIRGCTSSTNKLLTVNVSGYNQTVIIDRNAHKNCREKQDAIADLENAACEDYDKYRKGLTPYLNGDEVPPSCLASLTKDKVATSVPATQDSMETCLVGTHTWLIPLYSRYKLCDRRSNNRTNITKRCDKLQETFESSFCSYELKLSDTCDYHSTCRKRELEDRSNTHDEVKISEQARKADYVTGRKVSCLFDVFLADNPNKTATLQRCRALQISTSPFDIIYHPVPPGEPCFKEPSKPCDEAWTTKEYGQLSAKAKTCTPCTAPTTAHTWGGTKPDMWLVAEDYDKATDQWPNRGEAGGLFDNVVHKGQLITATQSGHGAGADVKITAVTGTRDTHLLFRNLIKSSSSTLCTLTRYTGDHRQRILNGGSNWLWGHWGGRAGIAHTQTWITTHDHHGIQVHDWVVMCGQGANILANGKSMGNGGSFQMPSGGNVYVNAGGCCGGERSEFAIGEIMVWNSQTPDMAAASQYLLDLVAKGRVQKANGPAQMYRMDVSKNAGASYWCIEELTFYDASGNRLSTSPSGGAAETEYASIYAAGKAFNERTNNDESYYCSLSGKPTGWLQYTFSSAVQVASYRVERLNGHGNQYSPVAWTFEASTDGGQTWSTLDTQSGHASWSDGEVKTFQIAQASSSQASSSASGATSGASMPIGKPTVGVSSSCGMEGDWFKVRGSASCMLGNSDGTPLVVDYTKKTYTKYTFTIKMGEANAHNGNVPPHGGFKPCNRDATGASRGSSPELWFIDRGSDWGWGTYNGGWGHDARYQNLKGSSSDPNGMKELPFEVTMKWDGNHYTLYKWKVADDEFPLYEGKNTGCRPSDSYGFTPRLWAYSSSDVFYMKDLVITQSDDKL